MAIRSIQMIVGNLQAGNAIMGSYPHFDGITYSMPLYSMTVSGTNDAKAPVKKTFPVLRFGIQRQTALTRPKVVGLSNAQTHTIKSWLPSYLVHSATSPENGAWQVYGNFLVHDGPDDPSKDLFGSIGCIEICGPNGFVELNKFIVSISGSTAASSDMKLAEIGRSGKMTIQYLSATRPALKAL